MIIKYKDKTGKVYIKEFNNLADAQKRISELQKGAGIEPLMGDLYKSELTAIKQELNNMNETIDQRLLKQLLNEGILKEGDVVYIATSNWQNIWDSNRSLHRFPSDDIMEKLKPIYINKSLGKITKVTDKGFNVDFDGVTFFMKPEWISLLSGKKTL